MIAEQIKSKVKSKSEISYKAKGLVYGHLWGGGEGAYPSKTLTSKTTKGLLKQAHKGLDGSLDGGMGFESLTGALLNVTKTTKITIKEKEFINEESGIVFVGNLTEEQQDFLEEVYYNE